MIDQYGTNLKKYKVMESQFELYNQKSAVANGIMDRINTYARAEVDITTIKIDDARAIAECPLSESLPIRAVDLSHR